MSDENGITPPTSRAGMGGVDGAEDNPLPRLTPGVSGAVEQQAPHSHKHYQPMRQLPPPSGRPPVLERIGTHDAYDDTSSTGICTGEPASLPPGTDVDATMTEIGNAYYENIQPFDKRPEGEQKQIRYMLAERRKKKR